MANFLFGYQGYLYICGEDDNTDLALTGRPSTGVHFNNANWTDYANIRDVTTSGNNQTVDTTTRDEARSGVSTEVIATVTQQLQFEIRWKPNDDFGTPSDPIFRRLLKANINKSEIGLLDLDQPITHEAAVGTVGNYIIAFVWNKPVQGIQSVQVTASLSSFFNWIEAQDTSGTNFAIIS